MVLTTALNFNISYFCPLVEWFLPLLCYSAYYSGISIATSVNILMKLVKFYDVNSNKISVTSFTVYSYLHHDFIFSFHLFLVVFCFGTIIFSYNIHEYFFVDMCVFFLLRFYKCGQVTTKFRFSRSKGFHKSKKLMLT